MHTFQSRVFFSDVDLGGVVFFANYLRYFDNARTTYFNELGLGFGEQLKERKIFAVVECRTQYKKSLRLDDAFSIRTEAAGRTAVTLELAQTLESEGQVCCLATMRLAYLNVDQKQRPARIPDWFIEKLGL